MYQKLKKLIIVGFLALICTLTIIIATIYYKKDAIIEAVLSYANADFKGYIQIKDANIAAFKTFPYSA